MNNYFLVLSYDGTAFNGWQAQGKSSLRTVQETLEGVAKAVFGSPTKITASGRTDAGVHAMGQVCSFTTDTTIPPEKIADCFNAKLPPDIRIQKSGLAAEGFDACRSAKKKTYGYSLYFSPRENPLKERFCVRVSGTPDFEKMQAAARLLEGEHDFKAFCAANSSAKTTVRTVYSIKIRQERTFTGEELRIYVTGNGFLYNMVRTVVGTLLDIGFGRKSLEHLKKALAAGDRNSVGRTMPAKGLCLMSVEYSEGN
ncbi:MAG: tRNA pseudouridine(38-40) synthase TruA [Clostridia bacterium]|nr:tRNA pseudouridine(38-40) synthase TruA [Clostridia bacterium]